MCFDHRHDDDSYWRRRSREAHDDARKRVRERVEANNRFSSPRTPSATGGPWWITLLIAGLFAAGVGLPPARLLGVWQPPACALVPANEIGQTISAVSTALSYAIAFVAVVGLLLCGLVLLASSVQRTSEQARSWAYSCCVALAVAIGANQAVLVVYSLTCS